MMQKRTTYLRFGQLRQERGEKHVKQGELVQAENVCQTEKAGVYQKRKGFSMTTLTFSGATWGTATVSSCVPAKDMAGSLMRDSQDRAWARDTASNVWNYRGTHPRAWVDTKVVNASAYAAPRPVHLEVGANIWVFTISTSATVAGVYDLTIYVKATGQLVSVTSGISAYIGANGIAAMAASTDGVDVWLFWVTGADAKVMSHYFEFAAATTTPTEATFYTAGGNLSVVAASYFATPNYTLVAFGGNSGGKARLYHSELNTSTGEAKTSPATVKVLDDTTALPVNALGFHSNQSTNATYVYYHYDGFQIGGSGATYSGPVTVTVTVADLSATVYNHVASSYSAATDAIVAAGIAGVPIGGGQTGEVVIWSKHTMEARITCTLNGGDAGAASSDYSACSWWLASGLTKLGDYLYFLTAHDDIAWSALPLRTGAVTQTVTQQRSFHVRRMLCTDVVGNAAVGKTQPTSWTWRTIGHFFNGQASARFHAATSTVATAGSFPTVGAPPALSQSSNKLVATVAADIGSTGSVGISRIEIDTAKSWGKECSHSGRAYSPGSIPVCWSKDDYSHEISPLLAPSWINVSAAGTGSDFATAAAVYVIRDSDGTLYRSSPYVLRTTIGHGATLEIPVLHHFLQDTTAWIEIYLGTDAKPKLQATVSNAWQSTSPGFGHYYTYTTPTAATMVNGEVLYAVGNALTQTWPPQCQAVGSWRQRLFLAQKNTILASHEESLQRGPLFNEVMLSTWGESQTDINAMGVVDYNYFAVVGASGAGVIDGPGPDQLGSGNYVVKTLKTRAGMTIGMPCLSSDMGLYFQDRNTGRLMCITQQLQVLECGGGTYDYSTSTVMSIVHSEAERQIHFYADATTTGTALVIDYQHKTEAAPFGEMYVWPYLPVVPYAASEDTTGVFYLGSGGTMHRRSANYYDVRLAGTNAAYAILIKTAPVQLSDLQGEFDVCKVQVLLKYKATSSLRIYVYPNYSTSITSSGLASITSTAFQAMTRPANCMRLQAVAVSVYEIAQTTDCFEIEGFAIEWMPRGHIKQLNTTQVV